MNEIIWPEKYTPGTTDNYVSNEVIVKGLSTADVWPHLNNTSAWLTYYSNASDIVVHDVPGTELSNGVCFRFTTFGLVVEAEVTEHVPPTPGNPAPSRIQCSMRIKTGWKDWSAPRCNTREKRADGRFLVDDYPSAGWS